MAKNQTQIDREAVLVAKQKANQENSNNPALTSAENSELSQLQSE
jgi:hypothetical protein